MRTIVAAIAAALALLCGCAPAGRAAPPGEKPPASAGARELTADQQVRHALARLSFGARPGDVERVRAMGVDRWIEHQLHPERIADTAMERFLQHFPAARLSTTEAVRDYAPLPRAPVEQRREAARRSRALVAELQGARVARAVASERQLEEVMVDFWLNHFNVFAGKGPTRFMLAEYEREAIRPHALGRFRDLLGAVAHSPAMLFYLDNWQSTVEDGRPTSASRGIGSRRNDDAPPRPRGDRRSRGGAPADAADSARRIPPGARRPRGLNENYARELLELHTLGVDGGYTQQDVIEVARAFTGWTIAAPRRRPAFLFRPAMHDAGGKVVLGHRLAAGRGAADGEEVLDILARHPATARFIAAKLARRFVSDSPPPALVARAAETFTRTDGDIREVLRAIVTSPEFFSRDAYRAKVKSPLELVASALRAVGAPPDSTPRSAMLVARLGQPLYGRQTPDGWPETGSSWINTGAILERINFALALSRRLPVSSSGGSPLPASLAGASRAAQADAVITALLGGEASPDTRRILESGTNPLLGRAPPAGGLATMIGLALGSPEFQRR